MGNCCSSLSPCFAPHSREKYTVTEREPTKFPLPRVLLAQQNEVPLTSVCRLDEPIPDVRSLSEQEKSATMKHSKEPLEISTQDKTAEQQSVSQTTSIESLVSAIAPPLPKAQSFLPSVIKTEDEPPFQEKREIQIDSSLPLLQNRSQDIIDTTAPPPPPLPPILTSEPAVPLHPKLPTIYLPGQPASPTTTARARRVSHSEDWNERLDWQDFESEFKQVLHRPRSCSSSICSDGSSDRITFLEPEREKKVAVCRRGVALSSAAVAKAIDDLDLQVLPPYKIEILRGFIPTNQEVLDLTSYADSGKPLELLRRNDRWLLPLCRIERYAMKLQVMGYMAEFDKEAVQLSHQFEAVSSASVSLMNSERFSGMLDVLLALVNYANAGKRAPAQFLSPEALLKLATFKAAGSQGNLVAYAIKSIAEKSPEFSFFYEELDSIEEASKVSIENARMVLTELRNGFKVAQEDLEARVLSREPFLTLEAFVMRAHEHVDALVVAERQTLENYSSCLEYFSASYVDSHVYFSQIAQFVQYYKELEKTVLNFQKTTL